MLLTVRQFAQRARNHKTGGIGVSSARISALVGVGEIQGQRYGRMILIPSTELGRWNRSRRRDGRPPLPATVKRRKRDVGPKPKTRREH